VITGGTCVHANTIGSNALADQVVLGGPVQKLCPTDPGDGVKPGQLTLRNAANQTVATITSVNGQGQILLHDKNGVPYAKVDQGTITFTNSATFKILKPDGSTPNAFRVSTSESRVYGGLRVDKNATVSGELFVKKRLKLGSSHHYIEQSGGQIRTAVYGKQRMSVSAWGTYLRPITKPIIVECNGDCTKSGKPDDMCKQAFGPDWWVLSVDCENVHFTGTGGKTVEMGVPDSKAKFHFLPGSDAEFWGWIHESGKPENIIGYGPAWCHDTGGHDYTVTCWRGFQ